MLGIPPVLRNRRPPSGLCKVPSDTYPSSSEWCIFLEILHHAPPLNRPFGHFNQKQGSGHLQERCPLHLGYHTGHEVKVELRRVRPASGRTVELPQTSVAWRLGGGGRWGEVPEPHSQHRHAQQVVKEHLSAPGNKGPSALPVLLPGSATHCHCVNHALNQPLHYPVIVWNF